VAFQWGHQRVFAGQGILNSFHQHFGINFHPLAFKIAADLVADTVVDLGLLILEVWFSSARQRLPIKLRLTAIVSRNLIAIVRLLTIEIERFVRPF
jgi:hypothetical protein